MAKVKAAAFDRSRDPTHGIQATGDVCANILCSLD